MVLPIYSWQERAISDGFTHRP